MENDRELAAGDIGDRIDDMFRPAATLRRLILQLRNSQDVLVSNTVRLRNLALQRCVTHCELGTTCLGGTDLDGFDRLRRLKNVRPKAFTAKTVLDGSNPNRRCVRSEAKLP